MGNYDLLKHKYIIGLWCADGYHRTSSVGLTNCNVKLIWKFYNFFKKANYSNERIKLRIYRPLNRNIDNLLAEKIRNYKIYPNKNGKLVAYQIYVNDRKLLYNFKKSKKLIRNLDNKTDIYSYVSGRFDGDGSISNNLVNDMRIVYGNEQETKTDQGLLKKLNLDTRVYYYKSAGTYCLYFTIDTAKKAISEMKKYSIKISDKIALRDL